MADTKSLFTQRFAAARAALAGGDEPAAAESLHSAIVVARSDPGLRLELASALFQLGKLSQKFGRAGEAEAESLLTEALAISEGLFGSEHAALAPLLNELGRLHIHRSQFAGAAGVLERLLAIARAKGEENAEVATALAGLAVVKRKLGDDPSAEALYRDALRIREKVLEPNHMVTAVTREHLAETCAARGNFEEALTLLQSALATREVALGPGHATVQAARSRVAELELQVAVAADAAAAAAAKAARGPIPTPAWLKRVPDSPPALSRERAKTPPITAAVAAASLMASSIQMPSASQVVISPPESARPSESAAGRESSVPYRETALAELAQTDVSSEPVALADAESAVAPAEAESSEPARYNRRTLYLSAGVAAVAIALAGLLMFRPRAGGSGAKVSAQSHGAPRTTVAAAAAVIGGARTDSLRSVSVASSPAAPVAQTDQRDSGAGSPQLRAPRVDVHVRAINVPNIAVPSISVASSVDSMAPVATSRATDSDRTGTGQRISLPTSADAEMAVTPAKIIGHVPEPGFPDALLRSGRREGQVLVRFIVNERGRVDVATMIVEQSDDDLFTSAVRDILPLFRFDPALTRAEKPVASWVSVPFRFTTKKR
jgi:TonB family protein